MEKYYVKNVLQYYSFYEYTIVRDCTNEREPFNGYWYWWSTNDLVLAHEACRECGNGIVVESENIVPLNFTAI